MSKIPGKIDGGTTKMQKAEISSGPQKMQKTSATGKGYGKQGVRPQHEIHDKKGPKDPAPHCDRGHPVSQPGGLGDHQGGRP